MRLVCCSAPVSGTCSARLPPKQKPGRRVSRQAVLIPSGSLSANYYTSHDISATDLGFQSSTSWTPESVSESALAVTGRQHLVRFQSCQRYADYAVAMRNACACSTAQLFALLPRGTAGSGSFVRQIMSNAPPPYQAPPGPVKPASIQWWSPFVPAASTASVHVL